MSFELDNHISSKYDIRRRIGKGAYGIVWKSVDRRTGEIVALKKIFDAFTNVTDAQRTFREILFLQAFSNHSNVIKLLNVVRAGNDKDIYLVFEFMDTDLHAVIKGKILHSIHMQYIMTQLFRVVKYIHSGSVIHRDLKPSNVLINSECFVKLADFGLARSLAAPDQQRGDQVGSEFNPAMTDYVATRWYRSPEILLGSRRYTKGVDMWSLGCIMAEMIAGKPLYPGTSTMNQLDRIMSTLPPPSRQDVESINSPYAQAVLEQIIHRRHKHLVDVLPQADDVSLDLLTQLLQFNPDKRITADQCLIHPYVARFHDKEKEPVVGTEIIPVLDDNVQLSIEDYRQCLYKDIVLRHSEMHSSPPPQSPSHPQTIVEDCELNPQCESSPLQHKDTSVSQQPFIPPSCETKKNGRLLSRSAVSYQSSGTNNKVSLQATPPRQRPSLLHHTTFTRSPNKPQLIKPHSSPQSRGNDKEELDLTVTSARMIPVSRPSQWREVNKKVQRGGPSRLASGSYTQTYGSIRRSELHKLTHNNW